MEVDIDFDIVNICSVYRSKHNCCSQFNEKKIQEYEKLINENNYHKVLLCRKSKNGFYESLSSINVLEAYKRNNVDYVKIKILDLSDEEATEISIKEIIGTEEFTKYDQWETCLKFYKSGKKISYISSLMQISPDCCRHYVKCAYFLIDNVKKLGSLKHNTLCRRLCQIKKIYQQKMFNSLKDLPIKQLDIKICSLKIEHPEFFQNIHISNIKNTKIKFNNFGIHKIFDKHGYNVLPYNNRLKIYKKTTNVKISFESTHNK